MHFLPIQERFLIDRSHGKLSRQQCMYIDSGTSLHMTKNKNNFSHLKEKDMQFQIELGDEGMYATRGVGTINFQRESGNPLHL